MKKTANIKIPLSILQLLDDRGQFNPQYLNEWFDNYAYYYDEGIFTPKGLSKVNEPLKERTLYYSFKMEGGLYDDLVEIADSYNLSTSEFLGRVLSSYYDKENKAWLSI